MPITAVTTSEFNVTRGNMGRRLSTTNPANPASDEVSYERDQVNFRPAIFDARYLAWRIVNPDHPLAQDPEYWPRGRWPRQQALDTCSLLQLYQRLERTLVRYQMEYGKWCGKSNVLIMPNQFLEPQAGWKLADRTVNKVYEVKAVGTSKDEDNKKTFDGRVILKESSGPPTGHILEWQDPYGEVDEQPKLIKLIREEDARQLLEPRGKRSGGETEDVRSMAFTPTVGYQLVRHEPGSIDNHPFGPNRELKPRVRAIFQDPTSPNMTQKIWGWWMDTIIEFEVYAIGGKIADRLTVWLRNYFMMYTGVLKQLGVQEILYWATKRDREQARQAYDLSVRNVQYFFRLEEIMVETNPKIGAYTMALKVLSDEDPIGSFTSEVAAPEFPTDTSGTEPLYGVPDIGDGC